MNKTAIKNFAIWARNKLRADITLKAGLLGITDKGIVEPSKQSTDDLQIFDIGTSQPVQLKGKTAIEQRKSLVATIRAKNLKHPEAFDAVIEEVAYTWFNRLIAVRFMEVNDYLPSRVRVLSSENPAKAEPDFVTNPFDTDLEFTPAELDLIDDLKDHNKSDELFQFLFIKQCNKLNEILPELFEKTNDYTELLLNVSFTDKDGVVWHLVHDISEDDFNIEKEGQVEIIGWLYQYYNTEPKDKVFGRPSGQKIRKEDVPAATQLFTPDWIVRYMVENSLGRIAIHNLKYGDWNDTERAKIDTFKAKWKYYLEEAEQSQEIIDRFRFEESNKYNGDEPPYVNSTFLDPCMGSGHILVCAFDVFMDIYTAQGYTERDAAQRIVEKNLYGLELDDRATQLAYFAVMMKARSYDRRFFTRGIRPNLCSIQESNSLNTDYLELFGDLLQVAQKLVDEFIDAKEYGSILNLNITADEIAQLESKYAEIDEATYDNIFDTIRQVGLRTAFAPLLKQAKIMVQKYDVVCTNPPYMGGSGMSIKLNAFVKNGYPDSKTDLYSVFMESCWYYTSKCGYTALIVPQSWISLSSFIELRKKIIYTESITQALLLDKETFESGLRAITFISFNKRLENFTSLFLEQKNSSFSLKPFDYSTTRKFTTRIENFLSLNDCQFMYDASEKVWNTIKNEKRIADYAVAKPGMQTSDNDRFLKLWYEVPNNNIGFGMSHEDATFSRYKWFPYNKGIGFRKWFGNNDYVVNYYHDGEELKYWLTHNPNDPSTKSWSRNLRNYSYYFNEGITFTAIGEKFSSRINGAGYLFDTKGPMIFGTHLEYICGFTNTVVFDKYNRCFCKQATKSFASINDVPLIIDKEETVNSIVNNCVSLSKNDWDSFETSWDYSEHPFVRWSKGLWDSTSVAASMDYYYGGHPKVSCPLELCFMLWQGECNERFNQLKANEEELNRIFIDIYGLQDELTPEVEDKDVTVRKADLQRDMRSFVFYAVGCMFGRYSLYKEGIVYAGGEWEDSYSAEFPFDKLVNPIPNMVHGSGFYKGQYITKDIVYFPKNINKIEDAMEFFEVDGDNCIPITDTEYFSDDIVQLFVKFVRVVYGADSLEANLDFIAKALGNKGNTSREVIRNYFLNDFFKDHCKIYQKRPIYWLFDSGKQNGFKALVYMHRWNADTIGNMRVEYLHRIQRTYEKEIEREQDTIDNTTNNRDKTVATKRKEKLLKQLKEAKDYDAKVAHLALSRPDIDLDDGVKVNYEKVQTAPDGKKLQILAKI